MVGVRFVSHFSPLAPRAPSASRGSDVQDVGPEGGYEGFRETAAGDGQNGRLAGQSTFFSGR